MLINSIAMYYDVICAVFGMCIHMLIALEYSLSHCFHAISTQIFLAYKRDREWKKKSSHLQCDFVVSKLHFYFSPKWGMRKYEEIS